MTGDGGGYRLARRGNCRPISGDNASDRLATSSDGGGNRLTMCSDSRSAGGDCAVIGIDDSRPAGSGCAGRCESDSASSNHAGVGCAGSRPTGGVRAGSRSAGGGCADCGGSGSGCRRCSSTFNGSSVIDIVVAYEEVLDRTEVDGPSLSNYSSAIISPVASISRVDDGQERRCNIF